MTSNPIKNACRLLREGAAELKNCHTLAATGHDWTGEPEAKAAYDEHMATADALERVHAECEALRTGYAAARLEIESLRARSVVPAVREAVAKAIYDQWVYKDGWVAWVNGGNSLRQDDARRLADLAFAMAQAAPELTETAVTAKNPAAPVSSFEDSRTQAVYEVLVNDNYPPAGSGEHWEGWKARLIVDALFPIEAPAAVAGPSEAVKFTDQSTADPVEKARRYLTAMGSNHLHSSYFFDDGYPKQESAADALATLAVLEQLAAAPTTQPAPQHDGEFWPVDENASRKQLIAQIGQMNFRLTALRQENAGLIKRVAGQAEALQNYQWSHEIAHQQEAQEPVAWYVTGCGRLLDEYEAEAEARRIGGTAKAMPLYTVPQPSPVSQGDALDAARWRETLMHVGAANHLGGQHFTLNTLRIVDQMFLLRGSVAQHFTKCIDASRAARAAQEGK